MVRSFGFIVKFDCFGSNAIFGDEFDGRDKKVVVKAPIIFIKVVE